MSAALSLTRKSTTGRGLRLVLIGFVLVLHGCSDPQTAENERLREEIIAVHDEAMDKIGYMFVLETKLKKFQPAQELGQDLIDQKVIALQEANRAMFKWMNQYQTLFIGDDITRDNEYRREQLEKIKTISRMTNQAIVEAEQTLSNN